MNYPSNSQTDKKASEKKNIEKVTSGGVQRRKKPLGKRISDTFVNADASAVWNFVVMDVIVPAAKDMLSDAVSQGIDQILFGGEARLGRGRYGNRQPSSNGIISYNRYSGSNTMTTRPDPRKSPAMSRRARATHNFDEIVLETRVEADEVIERLYDLLNQYQVATVSDLYDLVGIESNFTDEKWGWTSLSGSGVAKVRGGGYLLNLPQPESID